MTKTKISSEVRGVVKELVAATPIGWQSEQALGQTSMFNDQWDADGCAFVRFTRGDVTVVLNVKPLARYNRGSWHGCSVEGDTLLKGASFIRRGIDVSCCTLQDRIENQHAVNHDFGTLAELLAAQLLRCEVAAAGQAVSVPVPGLPFLVQPDWFTKSAATLRDGGTVRLLPHGFGTGYVIQRGTPRNPFGRRRASAELEAKLGVSPLRIDTFDYD